MKVGDSIFIADDPKVLRTSIRSAICVFSIRNQDYTFKTRAVKDPDGIRVWRVAK